MTISPFYAYYIARTLESLPDEDRFVPVFASSDINVYPFQIAAANFALRSPYQKGIILCDESGMGKSHEAMLVVTQKWYEGKNRILFVIPNSDLLFQWVELIEKHYTVPLCVMHNTQCIIHNKNPFEQDGIVITTYDFLADNALYAMTVKWDITIFEEANALSSVYMDDNKQAKMLKSIADDSFKLLLTGTPIEKNIMDLYGLIYFIDETILPNADYYMKRYLRKPENYPELAERVSKYCFRTLRSQAKQYAKISERVPITYEYTLQKKERELYELLYAYINKEKKIAFPEMSSYDLALKLLGLQSSSTAAILQTIKGIIKRLEAMPNALDEMSEFKKMLEIAQSIEIDEKAKQLLRALDKIFRILKKIGANKKALIFTESVETQKYLYGLLKDKYNTLIYNGNSAYSAIKAFKADGEILISTDNGARGFNLEDCSFVINYDLLFNTLKMEQRICRCHRLNQQNDVISLAFIDKINYADVRKLELINKRSLVIDGIFGISDFVIGGFSNNLDTAMTQILNHARTKTQVESDYQQTLTTNKDENKQLVASSEDILFTTFTKELASKVKITPQYVYEKSKEINTQLWDLVKCFFEIRNSTNIDCYFEIDETNKTITATNYEKLPVLFYYQTGGRNKPYTSLKRYGMAADFKPNSGKITLSSIIGRGIINDFGCTNDGKLTIQTEIEPCSIALYSVEIKPTNKEYSILIGKTDSGRMMKHDECLNILSSPTISCTESVRKMPHWLRTSGKYHELDHYVNTDEILEKELKKFTPMQAEEIDLIKLRAENEKSDIRHAINDLELQMKTAEQELQSVTGERMKTLTVNRILSRLQHKFKQKQEAQFFEEMQLDLEVEKKINEFLEKEKLTAKAIMQFIVKVEGIVR